MNEARTCEQCGAVLDSSAPEGLCPRCVLATVGNIRLDDSVSERGLDKGGDSPEKTVASPALDTLSDLTGTTIGRYKLLQQIGEGGFGIVFMAEQLEPVQRKVALKVIKAGMDTREVIARFEAERQALALMDHPNIAQVLDGGATTNGRPYFVMELVRGLPVTEYCDQCHLSTRERLELFIKVCRAVQHAHQKGVIHRDLKPSNVLVTLHDGEPVPKVIDFGVAKALGQKLTDKTLFTRFEQMIGTPAYMSPEQAALSGLDIDTRSDVYSLGVLLYELLTGVTPFDSEAFRQAGLDELRRMIQETEPPQPSTRLSNLGERLAEVARSRHAEPAALTRLIRGDLDWITMKALEKDRHRRYETVNGLAADLERYLKHEPVLARPPSALYRLQKVARRHQVAFAAGAVVAVALMLGAVISTWQAVRATRAEREQSSLREQAQAAQANEATQRQRAERNAAESHDRLVGQFVASGNRLVDEGDLLGALPWFAKALKEESHIPARADIHRLRLGTALQRGPKLVQAWLHDEMVTEAKFSPDGRWVLTVSGSVAQVWDATTGEPVSPVLRHTAGVRFAVFSPDGQRVAAAAANSDAAVWDVRTGRTVFPLLKHSGSDELSCLQFTSDGQRVLTASFGGTAQFWDANTGEKIGPPLRHELNIGWAAMSPDGRRIAMRNGSYAVQIWDAVKLEPVTPPLAYAVPAHNPELDPDRIFQTYEFSPDSRRLAIACGDGTARICDAVSGKEIALVRHRRDVRRACFSPDSRWLVTSSDDNTARVWEAESGIPVSPPLRHAAPVFDASFSPDGHYVVTASSDRTAGVWDAVTGRAVAALRHAAPVARVSFSPNGRRVVTASDDRAARVWEVADAGQAEIRLKHPTVVQSATFSPDGSNVVTVSVDGTAQVWDIATGKLLPAFQAKIPSVRSAHFSPDGRFLAVAGSKGVCQVLDLTTGLPSMPSLIHSGLVNHVEFSLDGKRLLTAGTDRCARVWERDSGRLISEMRHRESVNYAAFSPDGQQVVTVNLSAPIIFHVETGEKWWFDLAEREAISADWGQAQLWDAATGQPLAPSTRLGTWISHVAVSANRHHVIPACSPRALTENQVWVTDLVTGQRLIPPLQHSKGVIHAAFSPDGRQIATASWDHTARVWDAATGQPVGPPLTHQKSVHYTAFSPDNRLVVTVSEDHTARVWDAATGEPVTPALKHQDAVHRAFFAPDGRRLLTTSVDGVVRVWELTKTRRPVEDDLVLAKFLAGYQVDETGAALPLTPQMMRSAWLKWREQSHPGSEDAPTPKLASRVSTPDPYDDKVLKREFERRTVEERWRQRARDLYAQLIRASSVSSNQWMELIDQCSKLIDYAPDGWVPYPQRAFAYQQMGQFQKAIDDLRELFWRGPAWGKSKMAGDYLKRAQCYLGLGETEKAQADFSNAINVFNDASDSPDRTYMLARAHFERAQHLMQVGQPEKALADFMEAHKLSTNHFTLEAGIKVDNAGGSGHDFFFLAMSYQRAGDPVRAQDYFTKATNWVATQTTLPPTWKEELDALRAEAEEALGIAKAK